MALVTPYRSAEMDRGEGICPQGQGLHFPLGRTASLAGLGSTAEELGLMSGSGSRSPVRSRAGLPGHTNHSPSQTGASLRGSLGHHSNTSNKHNGPALGPSFSHHTASRCCLAFQGSHTTLILHFIMEMLCAGITKTHQTKNLVQWSFS